MIKKIIFVFCLLGISNLCFSQVVTDDNVKSYLREAYQKHFGIDVPDPFYVRGPIKRYALYNLTSPQPYLFEADDGWTAAIWDFEAERFLSVFLELDGTSHFRVQWHTLLPRCDIRAAVFIVDNGKTNFVDKLDVWDEEIKGLNEDWSNYFYKQGYSATGAKLSATSFVDVPSILPGKSDKDAALVYLNEKGYNAEEFDVFVWLTLDPQDPRGGGAAKRKITVGHFLGASDEFYNYTDRQIFLILHATFTHEIAHLFAWDHTTTKTDFDSKYIEIDPGYYGWTDVDGDGIVEMFDPTPYGRNYLSNSTQPIVCKDGGPNTQADGAVVSSSSTISSSSSVAVSSSSEVSQSSDSSEASSVNNSSSVASSADSRPCEVDDSCISLGSFLASWQHFVLAWMTALFVVCLRYSRRFLKKSKR